MITPLGLAALDAYRAAGDPVLALLGDPRAAGRTTERWLAESDVRRMIAWEVYGPLLRSSGLRVLDVGAGFSSLSYLLAARHDYRIADLCVYGDVPPVGLTVSHDDWYDLPAATYDLVIAVDIFPNSDQRLAELLRRYRGTLRMLITTYPDRWYRVRYGGDELLTVKAWDWEQTQRVLGQQGDMEPGSLFPNGRQVCVVTA